VLSVGIVSAVLGAILVVVFWSGPKEPKYQGKKLSEWLAGVYKNPSETTVAVKSIGTNAIPFLLTWIREVDSARYAKRAALVAKFPAWVKRIHLVANWMGGDGRERSERGWRAVEGFRILAIEGAPAIRDLVTLYTNSASVWVVRQASHSLAHLGKDGLPPLIEALSNPNARREENLAAASAIACTAYLGSDVCPAVPFLVRSRADLMARDVLERLATDPVSLPQQHEYIYHGTPGTDPGLRWCVIHALEDFAMHATELHTRRANFEWATMVARRALEDSDAGVRAEATNVLRRIAPEITTNGVSRGTE